LLIGGAVGLFHVLVELDPWSVAVTSVILMCPMLMDWILIKGGYKKGKNDIRTVTGGFFGIGMIFYLFAALPIIQFLFIPIAVLLFLLIPAIAIREKNPEKSDNFSRGPSGAIVWFSCIFILIFSGVAI
jgi:uncharacterized membrane protein